MVKGCCQEKSDFASVLQSKPPIVPRKSMFPIRLKLHVNDIYLHSSHCTTNVSLPNNETVIRFQIHTVVESSGYPHNQRYFRWLKAHEVVVLKDKDQGKFVYKIKLLTTYNNTYL